VTLATDTSVGAVVVPESAVLASERGFVVYVVQGGKAKERPVRIGLRTGDGTVEILSGLGNGETIVTEGSDRLADGMSVEGAAPAPAGPR
jgi:multidrug efflux system membrane fusion protein